MDKDRLEKEFSVSMMVSTPEEREEMETDFITELLGALPRNVGAELVYNGELQEWEISNGKGIEGAVRSYWFDNGELVMSLHFSEFKVKRKSRRELVPLDEVI